MSKTVVRRFGDREVRLTSLDKVMFPEAGLTKGDLIDYVVRCAEPLLAALRNRPLTMERRVNGLRDDGFIQKHKPEHFPDWVHTVEVATSKGPIQQVVVDDLPTLVLVTNFGCLTLHVPPGLGGDLEHPDSLVLDLDPSTDDTPRMRQAGHRVRGLLDELGLPAYARWSGSSGLHVLVPSIAARSSPWWWRWPSSSAGRWRAATPICSPWPSTRPIAATLSSWTSPATTLAGPWRPPGPCAPAPPRPWPCPSAGRSSTRPRPARSPSATRPSAWAWISGRASRRPG
jgi:DNA ligase D-like protein (predicted polymerase)